MHNTSSLPFLCVFFNGKIYALTQAYFLKTHKYIQNCARPYRYLCKHTHTHNTPVPGNLSSEVMEGTPSGCVSTVDIGVPKSPSMSAVVSRRCNLKDLIVCVYCACYVCCVYVSVCMS